MKGEIFCRVHHKPVARAASGLEALELHFPVGKFKNDISLGHACSQ